MAATLEKRLEVLEAAAPPDRKMTSIIQFVPAAAPLGELLGIRLASARDVYVKRRPRESEDALIERAVASMEEYRTRWGVLIVMEDRAE